MLKENQIKILTQIVPIAVMGTQLDINKEKEVMEWLSTNWEWVLLAFMVLEKIVKMSPSEKDDILLDVIVKGLTDMVGKKK